MSDSDASSFGILLVDRQGQTTCATGMAQDPQIQQHLLDALLDVRRRGEGMLAIEGRERAIAHFKATANETLFLVQPAGQQGTLFNFVLNVDFAHTVFEHLLNSAYSAMIVVDKNARVRFIPPVHAHFFGLSQSEALGKHVSDVIENTRLHEVVRTGKAEIGKLQQFGNETRVVARVPIVQDGEQVGAMGQVMFKAPETLHDLSRELLHLRSELRFYRKELLGMKRRTYGLDQIVGNSDAIKQLKNDIIKVAPLNVPVLILGETGTGKELAAHAIHALSARHENAMVFVNAAALPAGLVESELFGYEAGAFTGAERKGRAGKFELADQSSLFFDEIGDMPSEIQTKLLRVLQDGMFERVGGNVERRSDFRLICASNRNFQQMMESNDFRLDLYYRISGVSIRMPSLKERLEDIPDLVDKFLADFSLRQNLPLKRATQAVYDHLRQLPWPGNVRQLLHEVERAAIFCEGPELSVRNFRSLTDDVPFRPDAPVSSFAPAGTIQDAVSDLERAMISEAMSKFDGNKKRVAEELGISRAYLYKKLAQG